MINNKNCQKGIQIQNNKNVKLKKRVQKNK